MPIKLLIVDDEPVICRGLKETIPWEDLQVEVADTASDGADAIQKLNDHKDIDLVITDVKMPNVDGLQLGFFLAEHYPHTRVIIISGYDEFEYAQQAMQFGVQDYLLKPVQIDELLDVVRKVTNEIEAERTESRRMYRMNMKNAVYHQVFDFPGKVPDNIEQFNQIRIYPVVSMIKEYARKTEGLGEEELETLKVNWKDTVEDYYKKKGLACVSVIPSENIMLTCVASHQEADQPSIQGIEGSDSFFPLQFVIYENSIRVGDLSPVFTKLKEAINYLPLFDQDTIVCPVKEIIESHGRQVSDDIEDDLINAVFQSKQDTLEKTVNQCFIYFQEQKVFLEDVVQACRDVLNKVFIRYERLFGRPVELDLFFTEQVDVTIFNSYALLKERFRENLGQLARLLDLKHKENKYWLIEQAEEYIQSHYTSDIKAHEVAGVINISPNYFSSLFKQKTGKNFNEYVNEMRVEKAKTLLGETPLKVNEIAEQAGFYEYKYFVEVFKRFSGLTPTKYRKLMSTKRKRN